VTRRSGFLFVIAIVAILVIVRERGRAVKQPKVAATAHRSTAAVAVQIPGNLPNAPAESSKSYLQLLNEDRFCELLDVPFDQGDNPVQFLHSLGLDEDFELKEIAGANSPYFVNTADQIYTSRQARLLQALQFSRQMTSRAKGQPTDYPRALAIFEDLEHEEPNNGAYPLFHLIAEQRMGKQELEGSAQLIMSATQFDSHAMDLYRAIMERMTENASKFLAGIDFTAAMPMPSYSSDLVSLIRLLDRRVPGLNEHLAELMTGPGRDADRSYKLGGYFPVEYSVGVALAPWLGFSSYLRMDNEKFSSLSGKDISLTLQVFKDKDGNPISCDEHVKTDFYAVMRELQ
jgi:hypothetical protein